VAQGDLAGALQAYEDARRVRERLAASDPGNAGWQRDLSVSWNKLGDVRVAQGDLAGALEAYQQDLAIAEGLAGSDPGNAGWQRDLIESHWSMAKVLERLPERKAEAGTHWREALAITRRLADSGRLAPPDAYFINEFEERLASLTPAAS
jgi:tetratricopeptide (TPR) repeat protein